METHFSNYISSQGHYIKTIKNSSNLVIRRQKFNFKNGKILLADISLEKISKWQMFI